MDNDILGILKLYIMPIDDANTLPALNLRTEVLDLLLSAEVANVTEVWQLEKARIGEDVYRLKDHKNETKENRRKAGRIVERWYRMLTVTSENMKDLSRMEEEKASHLPPGIYPPPPPTSLINFTHEPSPTSSCPEEKEGHRSRWRRHGYQEGQQGLLDAGVDTFPRKQQFCA